MELPDAMRDRFDLVAAFLPGMPVPQRTDLPIQMAYERSRRIDDVVAAAVAIDPERRHDVVLTRSQARHDLVIAPWKADFGRGFVVFDPDQGAHFWQEQQRVHGGLTGHLDMTRALRGDGWDWVKQAENRPWIPPAEVEQFATAVVATEALTAALHQRPWESIGPAVAAELDGAGSDAGLGRLGWAWSLSWAAEFLDVPGATSWRKDCEHRLRDLHPQLAGVYHRRRSFVSGPAAMTLAAEHALRQVNGRVALPELDNHLAALQGTTNPATFASSLADIRERVRSRHLPHPETASLGFTVTADALFVTNLPIDIDGRLANLPRASTAETHRTPSPTRRASHRR